MKNSAGSGSTPSWARSAVCRLLGSALALVALVVPLGAQAATFTDDFSSGFPTGTVVTRTLGGQSFTYTFVGSGDMAWDSTSFPGNPGMSLQSEAFDPAIESVVIERVDGADFVLQGLTVDITDGAPVTVQPYREGAPVGAPTTLGSGTSTQLSFPGTVVDELRISSSDFFFTMLDDFSGNTEVPTPPTVTDANIGISGATGIGGAYRIGDTVTATWNNTLGGDNNSDVSGATVDFSQFGGGAAVAATNSAGTWIATYTIIPGAIDATHRNVSVTATNSYGSATTADTTGATVDNVAPRVTEGRISVSGATGTDGVFRIGDTVTVVWDNTAGGDNNPDTLSAVAAHFAQLGGGNGIAATNSSGTWTASYTLPAGSIEGDNRNVGITATDNAGNTTTVADATNLTVDIRAPSVSSITVAGTPAATDPTVAFTVTFSEPVTGLSADDFTLATTGSATGGIDSVSMSGAATATVSVTGITGDGSMKVNLNGGTNVVDGAGNGPPAAFTGGSTHTVAIPTAPGAPTIGTAIADDGEAAVAFTAPVDDGGSTITQYAVTSSPGNVVATGTASPIVVTGLANGTAYTFTVTATSSAGTSVASAASNSVTPRRDQSITFTNPGTQNFGTSPTLAATSTHGLAVVFSSSTAGVCTVTSGGTLTFLTAGTCTIDADQPGDAATNAATTVTRSFTVAAVVPGAPMLATATAADGQASVAFSAPASNGGSAITGYTVTSSPGGITGTGAGSPITVAGLTNGVAYTFTVTATNSAGTGAASAATNAVTPAAGQTITFANPGARQFGTTPTLAATSDSGLPVVFTSSTTGVCTVTAGGGLAFLTAGVCTIHADQPGNASYLPATQVSQSFIVDADVPSAPTGVTAVAGNTEATVTFDLPASSGGAAITGYTVTSSPGGVVATSSGSPVTVIGLTNGVAYTFTVTASNSAGAGDASVASNAVTPAPPLVVRPVSATVPYGAAATPVALNITGRPVSVAIDNPPLHGTAIADGASITYQPSHGYAGPDSFSYTASDGITTSTAAMVTITVDGASITLDDATPAAATGGTSYAHGFTATGGVAPYRFAVASGELPTGLTLGAGGALSGTPIEAGSFTFIVEGTDSSTGTGPFSAQRSYTLSVSAPTIAVDPSMPELVFGGGIDHAIRVSGGAAPYAFALTAGALPRGVSLEANGMLSGTPEEAGRFDVTVEVSDANGFKAQQAFELVVAQAAQSISGFTADPATPVFTPEGTFTLRAQGGASGNVVVFATGTPAVCTVDGPTVTMHAAGRCSLTADQAGGANFQAAPQAVLEVDIAAAVPELAWPEQMSKVLGESAFDLDHPGSPSAGAFTFSSSHSDVARVSGRTVTLVGAGTTVVTATQAAYGNYTAASIEMRLAVVDRPDPTRDPGVTGLLQAQVDASVRFATTQQANIRDRLRQVRSGTNASSSNLTLAYAGGENTQGLSVPLGRATDGLWPGMAQGWGAWLSGTATFGSGGRGAGYDFDTDGITLGLDRSVGDNLLFGIAGSLANNDSKLEANNASRMQADQRSLALYGLWRAGEHVFVDGVAGTGRLDFDLQRWSEDADALGTAAREGDQWFASLAMGYEHRGASMALAGYGRVDTSRTTLGAYREHGLDIYDLAYREQVVDNSTAALGIEGSWLMGEAGRVRPFWSVEYREALEDKGNAAMNYVVLPNATDYGLRMASFNDDVLSLSAGVDFKPRRGWLLSLLLGHEQASNATESTSIGLRVSYGAQAGAGSPAAPADKAVSGDPALPGECRGGRCRAQNSH